MRYVVEIVLITGLKSSDGPEPVATEDVFRQRFGVPQMAESLFDRCARAIQHASIGIGTVRSVKLWDGGNLLRSA